MKKAFTLIEMVIVIILLGILAAIVVPNQTQYIGSAKSVDYSTVKRTILNEVALIKAELQTQETVKRSHKNIEVEFPLEVTADADCENAFIVLSGRTDAINYWLFEAGNNNTCRFSSPLNEVVLIINLSDGTLEDSFTAY